MICNRIGTKRTINFLQRQLFRLTNKAEYHEPGDKVQPSVEADYEKGQQALLGRSTVDLLTSSDLCHGIDHGRESQTKDASFYIVVSTLIAKNVTWSYLPNVLLMQTAQAIPVFTTISRSSEEEEKEGKTRPVLFV